MTAAEFLDWDPPEDGEKYELVDGEIVAMGRDRVRHNRAKLRSVNTLAAAIRKAGVQCEAFIDGVPVSPHNLTVRIPDVVVHCGDIDDDAALSDNPVILVEVISPSSAERDEHIKIAEYFQIPSVAHYLVVHDEKKIIVHHRRGDGDIIETKLVSEGVLSLDPPGLHAPVAEFFGQD